MILNTQIWQQTVSAAKQAASNSPAWGRAIDRADLEIRRSRYWRMDGGVLTIKSTTSGKMYRLDDAHTCEGCSHGHKACKWRAARRLVTRYTERLNAAPALAKQTVKRTLTDRFAERDQSPLIKRQGNAVILNGWAV